MIDDAEKLHIGHVIQFPLADLDNGFTLTLII